MDEFRTFLISEYCDIHAKLVEFCHWVPYGTMLEPVSWSQVKFTPTMFYTISSLTTHRASKYFQAAKRKGTGFICLSLC